MSLIKYASGQHQPMLSLLGSASQILSGPTCFLSAIWWVTKHHSKDFLKVSVKSDFIPKPQPWQGISLPGSLAPEQRMQTSNVPSSRLVQESLCPTGYAQGSQNIRFLGLPGWDSDAAVDSLKCHLRGWHSEEGLTFWGCGATRISTNVIFVSSGIKAMWM